MGWVVTNLLICMVVFCLLIQWGVVASILFPKSFVVLVVISVIFMLSSPTCFWIRKGIGGIIYVWYVSYQTFLTKFVWCTFMLRLHHSCLKQLKSQKKFFWKMSLEIRQQKSIYKPLSNHLKYICQICFFQFWKVLKYDKPLSNYLRYVRIQIQ